MNKFLVVVIGAFILGLTGCATRTGPTMTPLEIQSLQTREFEQGKEIVFPSVISVFQDLGYTIKSADKDTGLITAESQASSNKWSLILTGISQVKQTSVTAFVEEIGVITKVRLNFVNVNTSSSAYGRTDRNDNAILAVDPYQNAFERIENAIFIRSAD